MTVKNRIFSFFSNPISLFGTIAGISTFSLAAAFFAEAFLKLEPCRLCIYQRYPFAIAILIGVLGLLLRKDYTTTRILLGLCSLLFLINAGIASYHTGVERHWWVSVVEGCEVSFDNSTDAKSMLDNIMSAPTGSCDDIPWADPVLGLSIANYNIILCFGLFVFCAIGTILIRKPQPV